LKIASVLVATTRDHQRKPAPHQKFEDVVLAHPKAKQILKQVQKIEQILGRDSTIRVDTI
jgi:hypothetical protein